MKNATLLGAALMLAATPALAQRPADFRVRYDRANAVDAQFSFQTMRPGWHVTSGRWAAILWQPALTASGNYRASTVLQLFPASGHAEGLGMILGGRDLDGDGQQYVYFLIRKDGQFLIKRRDGASTSSIVDWTANPAIQPQEATTGTDAVRNELAVEVGAQNVDFFVNGQRVHRMAREGNAWDGIVGLRVNHNINVHVESLTVTRN